jgi:hypothetical protein
LPPLSRQKISEREPADGDSFELMHLVAELGEHPANFTVLAFVEDHFENRALLVLAAKTHPLGVDFAFSQANALAKPLEQIGRRYARDLHEILLLDTVARMCQEICQVAVVREEDEAFARAIEPPHGEESAIPRHQVDHARSPCRIVVRGHHPDGLVEEIDHAARIRQLLAIDANLLGARIDLRAERGDDFAVHFDST